MSHKVDTPRSADWHLYNRAADNTEVTATKAANTAGHNYVTSISASFDTTASALLDMFGLDKLQFDATDTDVLDLTGDTFTISGHGFSNADKVVYSAGGGTAPTGLTDGNTYYIVGVSGDDFQLEATVGGGAIDMSGTQANFGTEHAILLLSHSWQVYDHLELDFSNPLKGAYDTEVIFKLGAVAAVQGILNVAGYSY